jgi:hypothetical protein
MKKMLSLFFLVLLFSKSDAQDNYEIQVYSSPTQDKGTAIFEVHSNFTFSGEKNIVDGVRPSFHALHETLEITQGVGENFEIGFYIFTNSTNPYGFAYVGSHVRPRVTVPKKWKWPVGASLSVEVGFQKKEYASDNWNAEIRPIIDKQLNRLYISFNPTLGIGLDAKEDHTPSFEPNLKTSYSFSKVSVGLEYYGNIGQLNQVHAISEQGHALFAVADLDIDPKWEINFGPGWGLTKATDGFVFKLIVGRRINWKKQG